MIPSLVEPVILVWGQSNAAVSGNNTGPTPIAKPSGCIFYADGVLQASFSAANHGVEVGLADELITIGGRTAATIFRSGINSTAMATWNTTHCATAIGHLNTVVKRPVAMVLIQGEAEAAASAGAVSGWGDDLENALGKLRCAFGGACGLVIARIRTTDAVNYPHHAAMRVKQNEVSAAFPHCAIYNVDDMPLATDGSGTVHYTSATSVESGRRAARALMAAGIL